MGGEKVFRPPLLSLLHWTAAEESDHLREVGRGGGNGIEKYLAKRRRVESEFLLSLSASLFPWAILAQNGQKSFYGSVLVAWRRGSRGFFHKAKSGEQLRICCPPPPSVRPPSEDRQPTLKRRGRRRNRVLLFLLYERALACSLLLLLSTSCFYPAWNENHPFGKESHLDTVFVPVALQLNIRICSCRDTGESVSVLFRPRKWFFSSAQSFRRSNRREGVS